MVDLAILLGLGNNRIMDILKQKGTSGQNGNLERIEGAHYGGMLGGGGIEMTIYKYRPQRRVGRFRVG